MQKVESKVDEGVDLSKAYHDVFDKQKVPIVSKWTTGAIGKDIPHFELVEQRQWSESNSKHAVRPDQALTIVNGDGSTETVLLEVSDVTTAAAFYATGRAEEYLAGLLGKAVNYATLGYTHVQLSRTREQAQFSQFLV